MSELHRRVWALEQRAKQDHQEVSVEELIDVFRLGDFQDCHLDALLEAIYHPLGSAIVSAACWIRHRRSVDDGPMGGLGPIRWTAEVLSFTPDEPMPKSVLAWQDVLAEPIGKLIPGRKLTMPVQHARMWLAQRLVRIEGIETLQQQIAHAEAEPDESHLLIPRLDQAEAGELLRLVEPLQLVLDGPLVIWIAAENQQVWTSEDKGGRPVEDAFAIGPVSKGFQGFFEIAS